MHRARVARAICADRMPLSFPPQESGQQEQLVTINAQQTTYDCETTDTRNGGSHDPSELQSTALRRIPIVSPALAPTSASSRADVHFCLHRISASYASSISWLWSHSLVEPVEFQHAHHPAGLEARRWARALGASTGIEKQFVHRCRAVRLQG